MSMMKRRSMMMAAIYSSGGGSGLVWWRVGYRDTDAQPVLGAWVCAEMELRSVSFGADQTNPTTPEFSFGTDGVVEAGNAFDDNPSTTFVPANISGVGRWIGYRLPSNITINEVHITSSTANNAPRAIRVQSSVDSGVTWSDEFGDSSVTQAISQVLTR